MSQQYLFFDQAGCIPGIAGTFANCRVDIDDEGALHVSPLVSVVDATPVEAPHEDAPTNVAPEPAPEPEPQPVEAPASESQEAQPEQPSSPPVTNGG